MHALPIFILALWTATLLHSAAEPSRKPHLLCSNSTGTFAISPHGNRLAYISLCLTKSSPRQRELIPSRSSDEKKCVITDSRQETFFFIDTITGEAHHCIFSPSEDLAIIGMPTETAHDKRYLRLYNLINRKRELLELPLIPKTTIGKKSIGGSIDISFSPDNKSVLTVDRYTCPALLGNMSSIACIHLDRPTYDYLYDGYDEIIEKGPAGRSCFAPNNPDICAAQIGQTVKLWDLRTKLTPKKSCSFAGQTTHDAFGISPDGTTLYTSFKNPKLPGIMIALTDMRTRSKPYITFVINKETNMHRHSAEGEAFTVRAPLFFEPYVAYMKLTGTTPTYEQARTSDDGSIIVFREKTAEGAKLFLLKNSA